MENSTTKNIVTAYYDGINRKDSWKSLISEDIYFAGGGQSSKGKESYVTATERFLSVVKVSSVIQLLIDGNNACALVKYELQSPKGNKSSCEVAEILTVQDRKITSSKIFFDTAAFRNFMSQG